MVSDPVRTSIVDRPKALLTVRSSDDNLGDMLRSCSTNLSIQGKSGHGSDLHVGTPEDSISHFDACNLTQRDAVRQAELTMANLAVLYPEVLPVLAKGHDAAPVFTLDGEPDF